jgi:Tol biopolymer transport system component/DNA-binding winged helix-turn-helix (wHTH) protein
MPIGEKHLLHFGPFQLDTQCGQLRKDGFGVKLQGQPVEILEILLEKPGELVTREELRQRLWSSDTFVDFDHSLNTAIKRLRQALGDDAETPKYIETIPKRGYRFVGEVEHNGALEPSMTTVLTHAAGDGRPPVIERPRHWIVIATLACIAVVALGAAAYYFSPIPQPHIVAAHPLTKTGFRKEARLLTDGHTIYFKEFRPAGAALMQVSVRGGDVVQVPGLPIRLNDFLADISKDGSQLLVMAQVPGEGRHDIWSQPLPAGPARLLIQNAIAPRWTAEERKILFLRQEGRAVVLYRASADGSGIERLSKIPSFFAFAVSPDGRRIRLGVGHSVWEANADGSNPHAVLNDHGGWAGNWSPDGKYYFFRSSGDQDLWAAPDSRQWYYRRSQPVKLTFGPFWVGVPSLSKDGKQLYAIATERHGQLSIYDSKSGQFVPYLSGMSACYVDFSRDGQWITYVSFPEGDLWRSRGDGSERRQLTWPPYAVLNPRWSPDGKLIVFSDISGGDRSHLGESSRIYVVGADGGQPMLLATDGGENEVADPTWSPDGRSIAYSVGGPVTARLGDVRILDIQTQTSSKVPGSDGLWSPRWSPDGKYLLAFRDLNASKLMLFSFSTQQWSEIGSSLTSFGWPAWIPDSRHIVLYDDLHLVRIDISDGRKEHIADLNSFRPTAYFFWEDNGYGITPDGTPIATRDTSTEEIYAFDLEYK